MHISIVVPVYNKEKYIDECIESIILQSKKDIEVILVDDGSTDSSGAIIERQLRYVLLLCRFAILESDNHE